MLNKILIITAITISFVSTTGAKSTNPYIEIINKQDYGTAIRSVLIQKSKKFNNCYKYKRSNNKCLAMIESEKDNVSMMYRLFELGYNDWIELLTKRRRNRKGN